MIKTSEPAKKKRTFHNTSRMPCYHCKKEGHFMRQCPKKYPYVYGDKSSNPIDTQAQAQGDLMQQNYMQGKVNNMTLDDA